jgi:hypothetical protein
MVSAAGRAGCITEGIDAMKSQKGTGGLDCPIGDCWRQCRCCALYNTLNAVTYGGEMMLAL